jgi:hypothetical protein
MRVRRWHGHQVYEHVARPVHVLISVILRVLVRHLRDGPQLPARCIQLPRSALCKPCGRSPLTLLPTTSSSSPHGHAAWLTCEPYTKVMLDVSAMTDRRDAPVLASTSLRDQTTTRRRTRVRTKKKRRPGTRHTTLTEASCRLSDISRWHSHTASPSRPVSESARQARRSCRICTAWQCYLPFGTWSCIHAETSGGSSDVASISTSDVPPQLI